MRNLRQVTKRMRIVRMRMINVTEYVMQETDEPIALMVFCLIYMKIRRWNIDRRVILMAVVTVRNYVVRKTQRIGQQQTKRYEHFFHRHVAQV